MTEKVNPSPFRPAEAFKTAGAIALAGGTDDGWIVGESTVTDISEQDTSLSNGDLNAFTATTSSSSLTVTIDGGEAFVYGSWLAKDTDTTVTLDASTTGQIVYVGWDKGTDNDVIIGRESAFSQTAGDTDEKIPLYSFDTDGSGVTSTEDRRAIGKHITATQLSTYTSVDSSETLRVLDGTAMVTGGPYTVDGKLAVNGSFNCSIGPIGGTGTLSGTGTIRATGSNNTVEPISATIDGNTFVAISGWTTDNDTTTYDAYRFERGGSIEIEGGEALTLTV